MGGGKPGGPLEQVTQGAVRTEKEGRKRGEVRVLAEVQPRDQFNWGWGNRS